MAAMMLAAQHRPIYSCVAVGPWCMSCHSQHICCYAGDDVCYFSEQESPMSNADRVSFLLKLYNLVLTINMCCCLEDVTFAVVVRIYIYLHCFSIKVPTFKLSVTSSNLNCFSKFLHCWKHMKFATKPIQHYPPHLRHVATIPCQIQNFCRYSAHMEENANKLHFYPL